MAKKPWETEYTEEYIHQKTREAFEVLDYEDIWAVVEKASKEGKGMRIGLVSHTFIKILRSEFNLTEEQAALTLIGSACAVLAAVKEKKRKASNN